MKVVITSATSFEMEKVKEAIELQNIESPLQLSFYVTGVGMLATCFSLTKLIFEEKPHLVLQIGIAGSFDAVDVSTVVAVKQESLADMGVEENDIFKDLFDINLAEENLFPFHKSKLNNPWLPEFNLLRLDEATGITVNEISTRPGRIKQLKQKYNAQVESMEGAALHYCCLQTSTPFLQIRSISNYIGERDKTKWKLDEAFNNLANVAKAYINQLSLK